MRIDELAARAEDDAGDPVELGAVLTELLALSPAVGSAIALGLLAREPRVKPSRSLLIDPADDAYRRWRRRVVAAAALIDAAVRSPELADELAESSDLRRDAGSLAQQGSLRPQ